MIQQKMLEDYVRSEGFLARLGLETGTALALTPLGQGEYNANFRFVHPRTGRALVLRVNTGSQMHLERQVEYECAALRELYPSGRTPEALFCDDSRSILPYGTLVMEWLPGRALRYETDMGAAAEILADIHALPVAEDSKLLRAERPARAIYEECLAMGGQYLSWDGAEKETCRLIETLTREIGALPLDAPSAAPRCMVNTELNSGNFLINEGRRSYLIDWEKPLISEPAQDLGHFLVPTTTFWKTDVILTAEEIGDFVRRYVRAVDGRMETATLHERLPLFFTVTCLRGVTWCAMALREYSQPGRALTNADTLRKIRQYVEPSFLEMLLRDYVRRDFLKGVC